ncbi:MAG TPA: lytic transglycosylase domain-containing protein, partial [Sphingopyxis sp.]|nr:lytic transglycosylase domain-containing protein [Sphingopyxis sp.]
MTKTMISCAVLAISSISATAFAADSGNRDIVSAPQTVPDILSSKQKQLYTQVLTAIRGQRWADAKSLLDGADNSPLNDFLRAELLTAPNSPRAEVADIMPILARSPHLPQAEQLGRLAAKRGATDLPTLPSQARLAW